MSTGRVETLADAIFAIAMTLLVLTVPVPRHSARLGHDLLSQWPYYAAYVVSFITLGIVWINHHSLMQTLVCADRGLVELNLLLLLFVALVPWPTELLAAHLRSGSEGDIAGVVYGGVMACMASCFSALWIRLSRVDGLVAPERRRELRRAVRRSAVGPAAYSVGAAVALLSPSASLLIFGAVAAFFASSGRVSSLSTSTS
jgi:uncharacterized membrane protein